MYHVPIQHAIYCQSYTPLIHRRILQSARDGRRNTDENKLRLVNIQIADSCKHPSVCAEPCLLAVPLIECPRGMASCSDPQVARERISEYRAQLPAAAERNRQLAEERARAEAAEATASQTAMVVGKLRPKPPSVPPPLVPLFAMGATQKGAASRTPAPPKRTTTPPKKSPGKKVDPWATPVGASESRGSPIAGRFPEEDFPEVDEALLPQKSKARLSLAGSRTKEQPGQPGVASAGSQQPAEAGEPVSSMKRGPP